MTHGQSGCILGIAGAVFFCNEISVLILWRESGSRNDGGAALLEGVGVARKGWAGSPPADDTEARKRIVDAAVHCVEQRGPTAATVSEVAAELGVTRKTVYRYFTSTEELLLAASEVAVDRWVAHLQAATDDLHDVQELLVETVAFIVEQLPRDPLLSLLLTSGRTALFSAQMVTPHSIARARSILLTRQVDWASLGYNDAILDEMTEHLIRITQSMIVTPPHPPRHGRDLREYLRRWVAPALVPKRVPDAS